MIRKSQYIIIRPIDTSLCFDTMAATISVPPVLPLWENTRPTPTPQRAPPITIFMNVC
ncbi:hypothetical protein IMSAG192_00139 [Muribaculaceae bacterium]|nr:hypothetical protein IMSAG192_00139 [Muribaculaceae bacterium]